MFVCACVHVRVYVVHMSWGDQKCHGPSGTEVIGGHLSSLLTDTCVGMPAYRALLLCV